MISYRGVMRNMGKWRLRFSMLGTVALIIGFSTLGFAALMSWMGSFNLFTLVMLVSIFNLGQWLLGPYLINRLYKVREVDDGESWLLRSVEELSRRSGIKTPKLMISGLSIPNAFAYGSPLMGSHVSVTEGLLKELDSEEVEAVIGHELGHLRHRDTQVMMFVSLLPSIFFILARSFMYSSMYDRRRRSSGAAIIGVASLVIYFVLNLFTLGLSRLREYYADQHSVSVVEDGARKLSEGLAKITIASGRMQGESLGGSGVSGFKTLFISDPDKAQKDAAALLRSRYTSDDELVDSIARQRVTGLERVLELFSTHPDIRKRLQALKN
ncbi:MAG: zinc metalloprotease HtpX [Candidatus Bathyarchaeia archaeon]